MRIVFWGTPDFAVAPLKSLTERHEVAAVVTQPDAPSGRGKRLTVPPVKSAAVDAGIPVLQPQKARDKDFMETLESFHADIFVVAAYGQILTQRVLEMPRYGAINIHASLLPKYRGASPIQAAILGGENEAGVTIMKMDKGIDTGDTLISRAIPVADGDTAGSLTDKLSAVGAELIIEALSLIETGRAEYTKQDEALSTYAPMIANDAARIDWGKPPADIVRHIRAMNPQPGAYTATDDGARLKVWNAILKDGEVVLTEVQGAGGKRMSASDYFRGHKVNIVKE